VQDNYLKSLHCDWKPLKEIVSVSLLLKLGGDPKPQLMEEVNGWCCRHWSKVLTRPSFNVQKNTVGNVTVSARLHKQINNIDYSEDSSRELLNGLAASFRSST